ncbi:MAG: HNH endonuclease [Christensenellales bacterium]|jgi:5-methylcytosine-specific restriction protein A
MTDREAKKFYKSMEWERLRLQVLRMDHFECQRHKERGRYKRANTVHHVLELKDRPDLATSIWHEGKRQLISLCKECHEEVHGYRTKTKEPLTPERW